MGEGWAPVRERQLVRPIRSARGGAPYVESAAVAALIRPLCDRIGTGAVADLAGIRWRSLLRILAGENRLMSHRLADVLISEVLDRPDLWHTDEALGRLYSLRGERI